MADEPRSYSASDFADALLGALRSDEAGRVDGDRSLRDGWVRAAFGGLRAADEAEAWTPAY